MPLREDIKALIIKQGWTMRGVVEELNRIYGRHDKVQNLSAKLKRGTIKFREVEEILEVIGYHIEFSKGKTSE